MYYTLFRNQYGLHFMIWGYPHHPAGHPLLQSPGLTEDQRLTLSDTVLNLYLKSQKEKKRKPFVKLPTMYATFTYKLLASL